MLQRYKYMANIVNAILPSHLPPPVFLVCKCGIYCLCHKFTPQYLWHICEEQILQIHYYIQCLKLYIFKFPYFFFFFGGGGGAEKAIEPTLSFKLLLHYPFTICSLLEVRFLISGSHFKYLSFCTLQSSFYGQLIPPSSQNKSPPHIAPPTQTWMKYIEIYKCKEGA